MRLALPISLVLLTTLSGFALGSGCSDQTVDGASPPTGAGSGAGAGAGSGAGASGSGGAGAGASSGSGAVAPPTEIVTCQGKTYECGDLIDNDGDGLLDSQDPDCLGPCDNTEDSYYGGIPGQAGPACTVDCYFDQDSGAGNDNCYWNHQCDPNSVPPNYHPESINGAACAHDESANTPGAQGRSCDDLYNTQSPFCHDFCGPLTPNGCDCFGCCELPAGSGSYVWLGSDSDGTGTGSCSRSGIDDPSKCEPCLPVAACLNTCGRCELCLGKTTLPDDCFGPDGGMGTGSSGAGGSSGGTGGGTGGGQCPPDLQPCGLPDQEACPQYFYCITGCCQEVVR
jgi:hypothetical protein